MSHINLSLDDVDTIDIQIISNGQVIGTLHIQKQGIAFEKPEGPTPQDHYTSWDRLPILLNGRIPHENN